MKPKQLTPAQARSAPVERVAKAIDRARQSVVRVGLRPYNVDLVWTRWGGAVRGSGTETVVARVPLVPSPVVELSGVSRSSEAAGYNENGTMRLTKVSTQFTSDELSGLLSKRICELHGVEEVPEPLDFYYEAYEDGRGDDPAARRRFRLAGVPDRRAFEWQVPLERMNVDAKRDGKPATEPIPPRKPVDEFDAEEDA